MLFLAPPVGVLLDVTLRRDGLLRRWTITSRTGRWDCRLIIPDAMVVSACFTLACVAAAVQSWTQQIDAAKAEGWA